MGDHVAPKGDGESGYFLPRFLGHRNGGSAIYSQCPSNKFFLLKLACVSSIPGNQLLTKIESMPIMAKAQCEYISSDGHLYKKS